MTTLTQSELDYTRRNAEEYPYLYHDVIALLDHIAELTAALDEARHQLDGAREEITCAHLRLDGLGAPRDDRDTALFLPQRIAELEAQSSAQFVAGMRRAVDAMMRPFDSEVITFKFEGRIVEDNKGNTRFISMAEVSAELNRRSAAILAEAALKGEGK